MKYKTRKKETESLLEEINSLTSKTSLLSLSVMIESSVLETDGIYNFEYSRKVTQNETKEQIDIEFDDNTLITLYSINGNCTIDTI